MAEADVPLLAPTYHELQDPILTMSDKTFVVRFKPPELSPQVVVAEHAEFQGEHLVFLNATGQFVALFFTEIVESWSEFE
ncbi:MAG: hypothetical protein WA510_28850 [Acidobacteriaceae bacterium]